MVSMSVAMPILQMVPEYGIMRLLAAAGVDRMAHSVEGISVNMEQLMVMLGGGSGEGGKGERT